MWTSRKRCLKATATPTDQDLFPALVVFPRPAIFQGIPQNHQNSGLLPLPSKIRKAIRGSPKESNMNPQTLPRATKSVNQSKQQNNSNNSVLEHCLQRIGVNGHVYEMGANMQGCCSQRLHENMKTMTVQRRHCSQKKQVNGTHSRTTCKYAGVLLATDTGEYENV